MRLFEKVKGLLCFDSSISRNRNDQEEDSFRFLHPREDNSE